MKIDKRVKVTRKIRFYGTCICCREGGEFVGNTKHAQKFFQDHMGRVFGYLERHDGDIIFLAYCAEDRYGFVEELGGCDA
jgi:hypothetical protein